MTYKNLSLLNLGMCATFYFSTVSTVFPNASEITSTSALRFVFETGFTHSDSKQDARAVRRLIRPCQITPPFLNGTATYYHGQYNVAARREREWDRIIFRSSSLFGQSRSKTVTATAKLAKRNSTSINLRKHSRSSHFAW